MEASDAMSVRRKAMAVYAKSLLERYNKREIEVLPTLKSLAEKFGIPKEFVSAYLYCDLEDAGLADKWDRARKERPPRKNKRAEVIAYMKDALEQQNAGIIRELPNFQEIGGKFNLSETTVRCYAQDLEEKDLSAWNHLSWDRTQSLRKTR